MSLTRPDPKTQYAAVFFENPPHAMLRHWGRKEHPGLDGDFRLHLRSIADVDVGSLADVTTPEFPGLMHRQWHEVALMVASMERFFAAAMVDGAVLAGYRRHWASEPPFPPYVRQNDDDEYDDGGGGGGGGDPVPEPDRTERFQEIMDEVTEERPDLEGDIAILVALRRLRAGYPDEFAELRGPYAAYLAYGSGLGSNIGAWLRPTGTPAGFHMPNSAEHIAPEAMELLEYVDFTDERLAVLVETKALKSRLFFKWHAARFWANLFGWMTRPVFTVGREFYGLDNMRNPATRCFWRVSGEYAMDFTFAFNAPPESASEAQALVLAAKARVSGSGATVINAAIGDAMKPAQEGGTVPESRELSSSDAIVVSIAMLYPRVVAETDEHGQPIAYHGAVQAKATVSYPYAMADDAEVFCDLTEKLRGLRPDRLWAYRDHAAYADQPPDRDGVELFYTWGGQRHAAAGDGAAALGALRVSNLDGWWVVRKTPVAVGLLAGRPDGPGDDPPPFTPQVADVKSVSIGADSASRVVAVCDMASEFFRDGSLRGVQLTLSADGATRIVCDMPFATFMGGSRDLPVAFGRKYTGRDGAGAEVELGSETILDSWRGPAIDGAPSG